MERAVSQGGFNVIHAERQLSACCAMSPGETSCLESGAALAQAAAHV